jgi:subtilisin family serine protease
MKKFLIAAGILLGLAITAIGSAAPQRLEVPEALTVLNAPAPVNKNAKTYIVQLSGKPILAYEGSIKGYQATKPGKGNKINPKSANVKKYAAHLESQHDDAIAGVGGEKIYSYKYSFNGFAAKLTASEVEALRNHGDVVNVWEDEILELQTNTSPDFLNLTEGSEPWSNGYTGENVVVGILDTGVNPEHPSFADVPTPKKGNKGPMIPYGAAPADWTGTACDFGNSDFNPEDAPAECSNKLLTAKCYVTGFSAVTDPSLPCGGDGAFVVPDEFLSARDASDHGSHTASTAAGNYGVEATINGESLGTISGMAPRARVAVYKICWLAPGANNFGCAGSDSLAAIDDAVADGVDVLNYSIGGPSTSFGGAASVAFLNAALSDVFVATSNGNSGPGAETVGTPAGVPWITSVGAAQDDGVLGTGLVVNAPVSVAGTYIGLEGTGPVRLSDAGDIADSVVPAEPLNGCAPLSNDIAGGIALVIRGACSFASKYNNAAAAGARAIVVYNDGTDPTRIDPIFMGGLGGVTIPGLMIGFNDGALLEAAASGGETVAGTVGQSIVISLADRIAGFSSRGPNGGAPDIIKPDVAAPGVSILAAGSPFDAGGANDGQNFVFLQGTSMSSPHVAGVFALMKQAHPDWSAAIAKSALMTTARQDLKKTFGDEAANPFDIGSGHIVPDEAFDPGLAYDAGLFEYAAFTCGNNVPLFTPGSCAFLESIGFSFDGSDLNYASIGVGTLAGSQTVTRTVTNVANNSGNKSFNVAVDAPPGIDVAVNPSTIKLKPGESATYEVTLTATDDAVAEEWAFGSLTWSHGNEYSVRSPIAVKPAALVFPAEVSGSGTDGSLSFDIQFGYGGDYTAGTHGLAEALTTDDTVDDDPGNSYSLQGPGTVSYFLGYPDGTAYVRFALFDEFTDGNDDLDLYLWACDAQAFSCSQIDASTTATATEQVDVVLPDAFAGFGSPGTFYVVEVHGWQTDGPDANYRLFDWNFGLVDDRGNITVTAPTSATNGAAETITVDWPAADTLNPGAKYLGAVSHSGPDGLLGLTLINISTE